MLCFRHLLDSIDASRFVSLSRLQKCEQTIKMIDDLFSTLTDSFEGRDTCIVYTNHVISQIKIPFLQLIK